MKRRDVIKAGAAGAATMAVGAGAVAGGGCATVPHGDPEAARRSAAGFLANLDAQLRLAEETRAIDGFVAAVKPGPRSADVQAVIDGNDDMFRRVMRSLFITQSFRDLSPETQVQPEVQARMHAHMDEIDGTVFALTDFLAGQTAGQRDKLREVLRAEPDTAMRIGEVLDEHAARAGLSRQRRLQLRSMMSQAAFRLRTESPGAIIDEYTAKVERLRGQDGKSAAAIALSERVGQRAFWKYQQYLAQGAPGSTTGAGPGSGSSAPPPPPTEDLDEPQGVSTPFAAAQTTPLPKLQPVSRPPVRGKGAMRAGGYMLGIGAVVLGVSVLLVDASEAFLIGMTLGAVLMAIGLIALIVGALLYAASS